MSMRAFLRGLAKLAKKSGKKANPINLIGGCAEQGCDGKVGLRVAGFVAAYCGPPECGIASRMGVAYPCSKCKKLHNHNGSALQDSEGREVFLDENGNGVVKDEAGNVTRRFWTTLSKPDVGRTILVRY